MFGICLEAACPPCHRYSVIINVTAEMFQELSRETKRIYGKLLINSEAATCAAVLEKALVQLEFPCCRKYQEHSRFLSLSPSLTDSSISGKRKEMSKVIRFQTASHCFLSLSFSAVLFP